MVTRAGTVKLSALPLYVNVHFVTAPLTTHELAADAGAARNGTRAKGRLIVMLVLMASPRRRRRARRRLRSNTPTMAVAARDEVTATDH
ncbi:hypothetical protein GCM10009838_61580 [Catenulispora subtropica]|uniref:Uncharacterized protein n=1 Tax=Catenulispora subtropica TaxID=450798 RepID=A0ABP5E518_9ACTN